MDDSKSSEPMPETVAPSESVLVLHFAFPGSAEFTMHPQNVSPAQMLAAAAWLTWHAGRLFQKAELQREVLKPKLAMPGQPAILH